MSNEQTLKERIAEYDKLLTELKNRMNDSRASEVPGDVDERAMQEFTDVDAETQKERGKYYGYPKCCIDWFTKELPNGDEPGYSVGMNTGFIPCPECTAKIQAGKETLDSLIKNRQHPLPFPRDDNYIRGASEGYTPEQVKQIAVGFLNWPNTYDIDFNTDEEAYDYWLTTPEYETFIKTIK